LGANALGIGDIRLHSALNQSLNAEIPLVTSGGEELADVHVTLAPPEAFARAGIERHYSLSKLRFTPQQKPDGSYVIKVSSQESIREPFLNFMIEVHWPQGRLQREFTVLLDPPSSFQEAESGEAELPEAEASSYYRPPVAQPVRRRPVEAAEAAAPVVRPRRPSRETRIVEAPPAESTPPPAEPVQVSGAQYGPIGRNETLWSIARQQNQDASISQEKMLQAIYRANPQAFYRNNINALKAGETITIPDRDTIVKLTGAPSAPPSLRRAGRVAPKPERPAEEALAGGETAPQGQLKLVAPGASKSKGETATSGAKGKAGRTGEDIALETSDSVRQENAEIRRSLAELREQLSGIQRLLVLKDEQIATLQAQQKPGAAKEPAQAAPVPQPAPAPAQPPAPPPTAAEPAKPPAIAEPAKTAQPAPQPAQEVQAKPPTAPKPVEAVPAVPPPQAAAPKRPPVQAKPAQPPAPAKEEGFVASLMEHPTYYAIGTIVGIFAFSVWLIKRRRAAMIDETESILTLGDRERAFQPKRPPISLGQPPSGISEQSSVTTASRSSFLSEFTPSDFDALGGEMEEVDPISEADVYLAYGRYKQAEELIRGAISQNPERDECKLKLLEIHYATENAQAFESFAQELAPTHKESKPEFWEKIAEMGQELCPDSPLFGGGGSAPSPHGPAVTSEAHAALEDEVYFAKKTPEEPSQSRPAAVTFEEVDEIDDTSGGIAYDFFATPESTAASELALESEAEEIELEQPPDNVIAFEFDKTDKTLSEPSSGADEAPDKTLDDILAELGVLSGEPANASHDEPETEEITADNGIDFDLEFKQMLAAAEAEAEKEAEQYEGEDGGDDQMALLEMDEQETKLDLAKAYFDMGDGEAARAILESVAEQGNDAQKEEAWSLLNRLTRKEVNRR
jgi:pilus assembly protein FimV